MKNLSVLPKAAFCVSLALSAAAEECHDYKLAFITKAKSPITIDGKLDEASWRAAKPITDFGPTGWSRTMTAFMPRTEARLLWDEKYLYVAMKCYEDTPENMAKLRLQAADKSAEVHQRDLVEFHVNGPNPGELPKLQIALTPTGLRSVIRQYDNGWGPESDSDYARVADYALAPSFGDDYWIVEAKIAHASLGSTGRVGFRLGFNLGRLRFGKNFVDAVTKEPTSVNYVLVHGWCARERSQHSTINGRGIFVEDEPANVVDGLRLSYPDLDSRTVLVQTDDKYVVVRNGKTSELGYVEKARELLADALAKCDAVTSVSNGIPEPSKGFYRRCFSEVTANRAKVEEKIDSLKGVKTCDVGLLTAVTDQCAKWARAAEDARWTTIRNLMFAEGKVRFPVELKVDPSAPKVMDQFDFLVPRPDARRIDAPTWLKPLANGRKKVFLAVAFGDAFAAWDVMHRLDVDADVVTMEDFIHAKDLLNLSKDYRLGKGGKEKLVENLLAQNKYDAYVFLGLRLSYLTPRLQCVFAERVIGGANLVSVNEWGEWIRETTADDSLLPGIPRMTRLGRAEGTEYGTVELPCKFPPLRRAKLGAGEYVRWMPGRSEGFREHTAFLPGWCFAPSAIFNDEYDYAVGVRAVAEGLGALGPARLASVTAANAAPGEKVSVTARATAGADGATLVVALRGADGKVVSPEQTLPLAAAGHYDFSFAGLPTGRYFVDAFARLGDKVCDAVAGSFEVRPAHGEPCRCTPNCRGFKPVPAVVGIVPARKPFKVADKIAAKVVVTNAVEGLSVAAELKDPRGRVIEKGTFPVEDGLAAVEFPSDRLVENCHFIALRLLDRTGATLGFAEQDVYRKIGKRDDLSIFTSGFFPGGIVGERRQAMLDYYGMSLTQDGAQTRLMFGGDAAIRHRIAGNSSGDCCSMTSPYYHERLAKTFREMAQKIAPYNGVCISCGDDSRVPEKFENTSPDWVAPFLVALGRQLAARAQAEGLAEWQVTRRWCVEHGFKMQTGDCRSLLGRFGPLNALHYLFDHPLYPNEIQLVKDACKAAYRGKTAIERFNLQNGVKIASWDDIDVKLVQSIRPTPSSEAVNFVFWLRDEKYKGDLAKLNAFWNADVKRFEDITQETVADLAAKGKYGAELDRREFFRDLAVKQFTTIRGAVDSVDRDIALFMGCSAYNNSAQECIAVTGSTCPYWGRHKESELLRTQRTKNSLRGATLGTYGSPRESKASREYDVWGLLIEGCNFCWFWDTFIGFRGDLGLDPGMCGYTCDELRAVQRGPASLLLRATRDNGGVRILQSIRSGALDGLVTNGRTPHQAFTVSVEAVERCRFQWDTIVSGEVESGRLASAKVLLLPSALLLSKKEAAEVRRFVERGGVALADSRPAFLAPNGDALEKGMLDDLFGVKDGQEPAPGTVVKTGKGAAAIVDFRTVDLRPLFALAGVKPICELMAGDKSVGDAEIARFVRGGLACVAWRKRPSGDEKYPLAAEMKFDGKAWTYDVRAGKALGLVDAVPLTLEGFNSGLFARLPYEVKGLDLAAPKEIAQGATLEIEAALAVAAADGKAAKPATHVFRVDLVPPGGYTSERSAPIPYRLVDAPNGKATVKVAIAWNEPVGTVYTLQVTDVSTGAKAEQGISVVK